MIVGLTGTKAAGKGIVAQLFIEKGYNYLSLSDLVREEAKQQGLIDYSVFQLQRIGENMRQLYGDNVLAVRARLQIDADILKNKIENYVFDGIRNVGEIKEFRKLSDFLLISIDAPQEQRFQRLLKRGRSSDPKDWKSFLEMDKRDQGVNCNDSSQHVYLCMQAADIKIYIEEMHGIRDKIKEKLFIYGLL
jgi:dephospho-CoA kinase